MLPVFAVLDIIGYDFFRALMSLSWEAALLIVLAWGMTVALRQYRASVRWWVMTSALLAVPFLPLLSTFAQKTNAPRSEIPVLPVYRQSPAYVKTPLRHSEFDPQNHRNVKKHVTYQMQQRSFDMFDYPWTLALFGYACITAGLCALVVLGRFRLFRYAVSGDVVVDDRTCAAIEEARASISLRRQVMVVGHRDIDAPLTIGLAHPVILVPDGFMDGLEDSELRAFLLHELAHVRRHDPLVLGLLSLLRVTLWFHPLVWMGARRASLLAEQACDELVLAAKTEPAAYARLLANQARQQQHRMAATELAAGFVFSKHTLLRRVEVILMKGVRFRQLRRSTMVGIVTLMVCGLFFFMMFPLAQARVNVLAGGAKRFDPMWAGYVTIDENSAPITIKFEPADPVKYNFIGWENTWLSKRTPEPITSIPNGMTVTDTLFACMQWYQYHWNHVNNDPEIKEYVENYKICFYDGEIPRYTNEIVDCVIPFCIVENEDGSRAALIDLNNDEHLTEDELFHFKKSKVPLLDFSYDEEEFRCIAESEYFNGEEVVTKQIPLSIMRVAGSRRTHYFVRLLQLRTGNIDLDGDQMLVGWPARANMEYDQSDRLWFDTNQSGKFDHGYDFCDRTDVPFTVNGATYILTEKDVFGRELTMRKLDPEFHPPIEIGVKAPEISGKTLKGKQFQLSGLRGKYVLIDFWGSWCGPCVAELPTMKEAYDKFGRNSLEIVGLVCRDEPEKAKEKIVEYDIPWDNVFLGYEKSDIENIYQICGHPTFFLIDPEGTIIADSTNLRGEHLAETLSKYLDK